MGLGFGLNLPNANAIKVKNTTYTGDLVNPRSIPHFCPSKPTQIIIQSEKSFSLWMEVMTIRPLVIGIGVINQTGIVAVDDTNIQISAVPGDQLNDFLTDFYVTSWYF